MHYLKLGPGFLWAKRYEAAKRSHGGVKLGSQKGVILAAQNEPKLGVSSTAYLHAGLGIGSAIPYAIHSESNGDLHVPGPQGSPWASAW